MLSVPVPRFEMYAVVWTAPPRTSVGLAIVTTGGSTPSTGIIDAAPMQLNVTRVAIRWP